MSEAVAGGRRQPLWGDFMSGIDTSKEVPSPQDWRELFLRKCAWVAQLTWDPPAHVRRDLDVVFAYWATGGVDPGLGAECAAILMSDQAATLAHEERDWVDQVAAELAIWPGGYVDYEENWSDYEMAFEGFLYFWGEMPAEYWPDQR